ncbi:HAD family hydrolase [Haloferax larsenii]|uniref:Putative hydrolase of the HAD superfamily n=1 Tax=Haloferax larsenii TaxID=302484 RepID=A0A1H7RMD1_HALLR|nr:HAD family hydrolase [Haloferax larsenii]SEL60974.1 putative hydrolase of the HAD superfamily [Haloferax larsenii]
MTTAVFFDLDLTVLQYTDDFETIFERALPNAPDGAYEQYVEGLLHAFDQLSTTPYRAGFEAVVGEFDVDAEPAELVSRYHEAELAATTVPDATHDAVTRVAAERPTGILTNGTLEMQQAKLEAHGLDEVADAIVVSNDPDVAARKPDSAIFRTAEESLPAANYVYVGDTYDEDIVGARNAGWEAFHVGTDGPEDAPERVASVEEAAKQILD